jgi:hypothetical protein
MTTMPLQARALLAGAAAALIVLVLAGGVALSLLEDTTYGEGLWLAFVVVSTTGFGDGPQTAAGRIFSMVLFVTAAIDWFAVLVAAIQVGITGVRRT